MKSDKRISLENDLALKVLLEKPREIMAVSYELVKLLQDIKPSVQVPAMMFIFIIMNDHYRLDTRDLLGKTERMLRDLKEQGDLNYKAFKAYLDNEVIR